MNELFTASELGEINKVEKYLKEELPKRNGIKEKLEYLTWRNPGWFYWTSFHYACWNGSMEICKLLIETNHKLLEEMDSEKDNLISYKEKLFIKEERNFVNMKSGEKSDGDSPLHFACWNGHLNLCKYLFEEHKADINCKSQLGDSLLHNACINGREEICRFLLSKHVEINDKDNNNNTPLHLACWYKQYKICKILLAGMADVTAHNKDGDTALHIAARNGSIKICRLLLNFMEKNQLLAHINKTNYNNEVPSLVELGIKNKQFCKYLCKNRYIHDGFNATERSIVNLKELLKMNDKLIFEFCADHDFPYLAPNNNVADSDDAYAGFAEPNELYQYLWTEIIDVKSLNVKPTDYTAEDLEAYVRKKLEKYKHRPEIVSRLAHIKDKDGRIALNIVSENVKNIFYEYMYFCGQYELLDSDFPVYKSATAKVLFALDHKLPNLYDKIFEDNTSRNDSNKILTEASFLICLSDLSKNSLFVFDKEISTSSPYGITIKSLEFQEIYKKCNTNPTNGISIDEFKNFCLTTFGVTRKVALKFMKNQDQYIREIKARKELDSRFVVGVIPSPDQRIVEPAIKTFFREDSPYKYVLIMPAADRSLDAIIRQEKPDPLYVKQILRNVAEAIDHLHLRNIMHGDVKALNVVRVNKKFLLIDMDACVCLNGGKDDFAGSKFSSGIQPPEMFAKIDRKPFKNEEFCLTKERLESHRNSSDFLNKSEAAFSYVNYHKYWFDTDRDEKEEVWKKVTPKVQLGESNAYVIRCYDAIVNKSSVMLLNNYSSSMVDDNQLILEKEEEEEEHVLSIRDRDKLLNIYGPLHIDCSSPDFNENYAITSNCGLVPASKTNDIWSYGILFYWLTSINKDMLLTCNVDSDFEKDQEFRHFRTTFEWTDKMLSEKITRNIEDVDAADLLQSILKRNPKDRYTITQILQHSYFTAPPSDSSNRLKDNSEVTKKLNLILKNQEKHTELLEKIDKQVDAINKCTRHISNMQDNILNQICKTERVLMRSVFEANEVTIPTCFIILNYEIIFRPNKKEEIDMMEKAEKYFTVLDQVRETVSSLVSSSDITIDQKQHISQDKAIDWMKSSVKGVLSNMYGGAKEQTLYFYLVDECTFEPIEGPGYPIRITKPAEFVGKVLPLLQVGFKAARLLNGAASLARLIGYPVPVIPQEYMDKAGNFVNSLNNQSSVAEYSVLQNILDEDSDLDNIHSISSSSDYGDIGFDQEQIQDRAKTVRGSALRELKRFLAENDVNNTFCGLLRVCSPEGFACWTTEKNHNEMKNPHSKLNNNTNQSSAKNNYNDNQGDNERRVDVSITNKISTKNIEKSDDDDDDDNNSHNNNHHSRQQPVKNHREIDHIPLMDEDLKDIIKSQYKMFETQTKILERITENNHVTTSRRTQESSQTCLLQ